MKSELAGALRLTEQGPGPDGWPRGAIRYNETADRAWLDEMLSEHCAQNPRTGERYWKKVAARNEAWDLAVYTRALARHETLQFDDAAWERLAAQQLGPAEEVQQDLANLWAPDLAAKIAPPPPPAAPAPVPPAAFVPRRAGWINQPRGSWLNR
jgi:phage terminase large subunit GpA-like protein